MLRLGKGRRARAGRLIGGGLDLSGGLLPAGASALDSGTYWTPTNCTVTGGQSDPAGGSAAYLFSEAANGFTSYGAMAQAAAYVTVSAGTPVTGSVYAKKGTAPYCRLILSSGDFSVGSVAWLNLTSGARETLAVFAGSPSAVSTAVTDAGGGWYRFAITATLTGASDAKLTLRMSAGDADDNDAGGRTAYFAGPRLSQP